MKRAIAVIGAQFGDEGKGLMVDYFCRQSTEKPIVVRYNGGAQAGHTVVTPEGKRHVFHHFGAGTLAGANTYLGPKFLVNPTAWRKEHQELANLVVAKHIFFHPDAPVTTVYDMFVNQKIEESRSQRHGSCGMGIHETVLRHSNDDYALCAGWLDSSLLPEFVKSIRYYAIGRLDSLNLNTVENVKWLLSDEVFDKFIEDCKEFAHYNIRVTEAQILNLKNTIAIFEGAQGLLLDQDNKRFFPHVTHSKTGLCNIIEICEKAKIDILDTYYVARSYITRHGAGELPGEDPNRRYEDNTNIHNDWQQSLRFAPQNAALLREAIDVDLRDNLSDKVIINPYFVQTHCDQNDCFGGDLGIPYAYSSYGPTADDVSENAAHESRRMRWSELSQSRASLS